jgi:acyl dehydratase
MIDKNIIGKVFPAYTVEMEKGRLRFFAQVIGETNLIYTDEAAARAAGHRSILVPPTFLFGLDIEQPNAFVWLLEANMNLAKILHGEQSFRYYTPAYAGDSLTFESKIVDVYGKRDGALEFVVKEIKVTNQLGEHVADLRNTLIQRNG